MDNRVSIKVRITEEERQALKTYTQTHDTTIQRLIRTYIKKIIKERN